MDQAEIETKLKELEERLHRLENPQKQNSVQNNLSSSNLDSFTQKIASKIDDITTGNLVLISLKITPNRSMSDIKKNIVSWGWAKDSFFEKGHFQDLVKKGLVHGTQNDKNSIFSLTGKGEILADKLIQKYELV